MFYGDKIIKWSQKWIFDHTLSSRDFTFDLLTSKSSQFNIVAKWT